MRCFFGHSATQQIVGKCRIKMRVRSELVFSFHAGISGTVAFYLIGECPTLSHPAWGVPGFPGSHPGGGFRQRFYCDTGLRPVPGALLLPDRANLKSNVASTGREAFPRDRGSEKTQPPVRRFASRLNSKALRHSNSDYARSPAAAEFAWTSD